MEERFMREALLEAEKAFRADEVPIGAVLVMDGKIVARAHNLREKKQNALCHAELLAIEKACKKKRSWRLDGATLYVTLEPCPMCAGAIVNARIKEVIFGAYEKKSGSAVSRFPILEDSGLNHSVLFQGGVLENECSELLKKYFKIKRAESL